MQQLPGSFVTFEIMSHLWNSLVPSVVLLANSVSFSGFYSIRSRNKIGRRWLETISSILTTVWCFIKKKKKKLPCGLSSSFSETLLHQGPCDSLESHCGKPWQKLSPGTEREQARESPWGSLSLHKPAPESLFFHDLPWSRCEKERSWGWCGG